MTIIQPPPAPHQCPHPHDGPLGEWYAPETLWQCDECRAWWYATEGRRDHGRTMWAAHSIWYPVCWWNWRLRKRIAQHAAAA